MQPVASRETERAARRGGRIVFIDVARGIALVAMTVYHFSWDLAFFGYLDAGTVNARPWVFFARTIATSFLFLVGVSLVLAHGDGMRWRGFLVRLAQVVAGAAAVTAATWWMDPRTFVSFGILHAIALFSVVALPFLRLPWWITLAIAGAVWWLGNFGDTPTFHVPWLTWTGLAAFTPISNDFVPLFPFFAATLTGIAFARLAQRRNWFERLRAWRVNRRLERPLDMIGRHSLAYYLAHQPVLFALIFAWSFVTGGPDPTERITRQWTQECLGVRDEAFCERYVTCVVARSKSEGLFSAAARNRIDAADRERLDALAAACATG